MVGKCGGWLVEGYSVALLCKADHTPPCPEQEEENYSYTPSYVFTELCLTN
jgi:hypothetical protein